MEQTICVNTNQVIFKSVKKIVKVEIESINKSIDKLQDENRFIKAKLKENERMLEKDNLVLYGLPD